MSFLIGKQQIQLSLFRSEFSDFSKITFEAKDNILIKAVLHEITSNL